MSYWSIIFPLAVKNHIHIYICTVYIIDYRITLCIVHIRVRWLLYFYFYNFSINSILPRGFCLQSQSISALRPKELTSSENLKNKGSRAKKQAFLKIICKIKNYEIKVVCYDHPQPKLAHNLYVFYKLQEFLKINPP